MQQMNAMPYCLPLVLEQCGDFKMGDGGGDTCAMLDVYFPTILQWCGFLVNVPLLYPAFKFLQLRLFALD